MPCFGHFREVEKLALCASPPVSPCCDAPAANSRKDRFRPSVTPQLLRERSQLAGWHRPRDDRRLCGPSCRSLRVLDFRPGCEELLENGGKRLAAAQRGRRRVTSNADVRSRRRSLALFASTNRSGSTGFSARAASFNSGGTTSVSA